MTDRPHPHEPERDPSQRRREANEPVAEATNEPIPLGFPDPGASHPEPSSTAGPAPEPEEPAHREPVEAEPHTSVEPVMEAASLAAPAQIAPEPGKPPIPMEPEPSVPEPVSPEPEAPVALAPETAETLALPPTTKEVEPPPVPSTPPPPTGTPVPFAVPPTERSRHFGLKLGLGIGGGALFIGTIVVAVFVAIFVFTASVTEKVEDTAAEFVGAIAEDDWDTAYAMLCEDYRDRPVEEYRPEWESWGAEGAEVQPMSASDTSVRVEFPDGTAIDLFIEIEQTAETLDTSVCGWRAASAQ